MRDPSFNERYTSFCSRPSFNELVQNSLKKGCLNEVFQFVTVIELQSSLGKYHCVGGEVHAFLSMYLHDNRTGFLEQEGCSSDVLDNFETIPALVYRRKNMVNSRGVLQMRAEALAMQQLQPKLTVVDHVILYERMYDELLVATNKARANGEEKRSCGRRRAPLSRVPTQLVLEHIIDYELPSGTDRQKQERREWWSKVLMFKPLKKRTRNLVAYLQDLLV